MSLKDKHSMKRIVGIVAAIVGIIIAAAIFHVNHTEDCLIVESGETGREIARFPMEEGGEFSVGFKHSVNQSNVEDFYRIENGEILVYETAYYTFGAGVQTEVEEGQTLSRREDGAMVISGIDTVIPDLAYNISPVYDHILHIHGEEISLRQLCKEARNIRLRYQP